MPEDPPVTAAWTHSGDRYGFESVTVRREAGGWVAIGSTTAVEDGIAWAQSYEIHLDGRDVCRSAVVCTRVAAAPATTLLLDHDGAGGWTVDGARAGLLDGCLDVDLEASALTNAFPVRRLLAAGVGSASVPAAYAPVHSPGVRRLEQRYVRVGADDRAAAFDYTAPAFGFSARITYDAAGLVLDYPGIAHRRPT